MKTKMKIWTLLLCACLVVAGCCDDPITPENPDNGEGKPPIENPDAPQEYPLIDGSIFNIHINNDIMANVGTSDWNAITIGGGRYVAVGHNGRIAHSTDGISWTTTTVGTGRWSGVAFGVVNPNQRRTFVAVGSNLPNKGVAYSINEGNWTIVEDGNLGSCSSITYGNGKFVLLTSGDGIAYSVNGINWTFVSDALTSANLISITYGNGKFVAVGPYIGNVGNNGGYSSDGIKWSKVTIGEPYDSFNSVTYGNGKYVAVGNNGVIAYSANAVNWTVLTLGTTDWTHVAYKDDVKAFVAVGESGSVAVSLDGTSWSKADSGTTVDLNCVCIM